MTFVISPNDEEVANSSKKHTQFKTIMEVKSVGTFPVILLKLATPPLSPQTKLNLEQNGWNWALFLVTTLLGEGGGGDDAMNPKPNKKMSLGAESYGLIACKGFFTRSQVLLSSIVECTNHTLFQTKMVEIDTPFQTKPAKKKPYPLARHIPM